MLSECITVGAATLPFALEHAEFNSPTYLFSTSKGLYQQHTMAVDLITGLKYPDSTMSAILAMANCVFCKWLAA